MNPLVTVICISFNHEPYIKEALNSVLEQVYPEIQIIILDDGSTDHSVKEIENLTAGISGLLFVPNAKNEGYTKTFNKGLALANGKYIVDFALDDIMLSDFVAKSVERLESCSDEFGVSFSNADYINARSEIVGNHNDILLAKKLVYKIPQGDIFEAVLKRYFICTPTMLIRKSVFDRMGGYDEALAYEDFDFWVRSSRYYQYTYLDEVLMKKRKLQNSMSAMRYKHQLNGQLASVFTVCNKAFSLCKTSSERNALLVRLTYEHRQCIRNGAFDLANRYLDLVKKVGGSVIKMKLISLLMRLGFKLRRVS